MDDDDVIDKRLQDILQQYPDEPEQKKQTVQYTFDGPSYSYYYDTYRGYAADTAVRQREAVFESTSVSPVEIIRELLRSQGVTEIDSHHYDNTAIVHRSGIRYRISFDLLRRIAHHWVQTGTTLAIDWTQHPVM